MTALPRGTILLGDVRDRLRELPANAVDCVVTSPPYFAVRDYGQPGQLGQEATVDEWVQSLRAVCAELARVLRPSGSLWLNLGDGYARTSAEGAAPKSLLLGPERLALALVTDGWCLRNKIVWAKPNPMPSSVRDRMNCSYEVVYFLTRSKRYFFDLDAIRVPLRSPPRPAAAGLARTYPPPTAQTARSRNHNGGLSRLKAAGRAGHPLGKNPGDVWSAATAGYRGAHFAVYPTALAERPIRAGCPASVCRACGRPDVRAPCRCSAGSRPGLVLDPFMGAGTTAIAAEALGREWLGIELSPDYIELAMSRIAAARGSPARAAAAHKK